MRWRERIGPIFHSGLYLDLILGKVGGPAKFLTHARFLFSSLIWTSEVRPGPEAYRARLDPRPGTRPGWAPSGPVLSTAFYPRHPPRNWLVSNGIIIMAENGWTLAELVSDLHLSEADAADLLRFRINFRRDGLGVHCCCRR